MYSSIPAYSISLETFGWIVTAKCDSFERFTFTADMRNGWLLFGDSALALPKQSTSMTLNRSFSKILYNIFLV